MEIKKNYAVSLKEIELLNDNKKSSESSERINIKNIIINKDIELIED